MRAKKDETAAMLVVVVALKEAMVAVSFRGTEAARICIPPRNCLVPLYVDERLASRLGKDKVVVKVVTSRAMGRRMMMLVRPTIAKKTRVKEEEEVVGEEEEEKSMKGGQLQKNTMNFTLIRRPVQPAQKQTCL
jgi:hypothetical protein